jgi:hypothetical protein
MTRRARRIFVFWFALFWATPGSLPGAETIPGRWELVGTLPSDSPIAIKTKSGESFSGSFQALEAEHLFMNEKSGSRLKIPKDEIQEITRPKEKRFWTRTKIGAIAGFATGLAIGLVAGDDGIFYDFTAGFNGLVLGGAGAAGGAILGATIENLHRNPEVIYRSAGK